MKILLANPNTMASITDRIMAVAARAASPGTELTAATGKTGVPYIATRAEAAIAGGTTLELVAEHAVGCDAAIVAAFGDPGLGGARELLSIPVVGLAEAGMLAACMLGRKFSIVTFSPSLGPWYRECVDYNGLSFRLAGVYCLDSPFDDVADVQETKEALLIELCLKAVADGKTDVVVLGGAPLAGLSAKIAERVPVPLVDPVTAAVKMAEALVALAPRKATAGSFRRPDPKPIAGVSPALTRLFSER